MKALCLRFAGGGKSDAAIPTRDHCYATLTYCHAVVFIQDGCFSIAFGTSAAKIIALAGTPVP